MGWLSLHIGLSSSDGIPGWPMATLMMMSGLLRDHPAILMLIVPGSTKNRT
jgi:hypothetical protein